MNKQDELYIKLLEQLKVLEIRLDKIEAQLNAIMKREYQVAKVLSRHTYTISKLIDLKATELLEDTKIEII